MRTLFLCSILSAALASGACNKKTDDTGNAATEVKKTQEKVTDEAKDYQKTVADKGATEKQLNKAEGDLNAARVDLQAARDKYAITVKDRLAKIDIKIHELELRADAKSKDALAKLQTERGALAIKVDTMKDRVAADWETFTKDVDGTFDTLEKDVSNALK